MKNSYWVIGIVVILVVGILGYAYKHQIKLLLMGNGSSSTSSLYNYGSSSPASPTSAPSGAAAMFQSGHLVAANGMTLYTFDKDTANTSSCSGTCASNWPAYITASAPSSLLANVGTFTRPDGKMQFTYNKMPLYYYSGDNAPGDTNGDGVGGVWHIVKQ